MLERFCRLFKTGPKAPGESAQDTEAGKPPGVITWRYAFRLMRLNRVGIGYFLLINAFGALGIWLPLLISYYADQAVYRVFLQGLAAGNWYMFSLPLLASGAAFVIREYRASQTGDFRHLKLGILIAAGLALFLQTVFVVTDTLRPEEVTADKWRWQFNWQIALLVVSVTIATVLYGLERLDDLRPSPAEEKIKERETRIEHQVKEIEHAAPPPGWAA